MQKNENKEKRTQKTDTKIKEFEKGLEKMVKAESKKTKKEEKTDIYIVLSGEFVAMKTLIIKNKA